MAGNYTSITDGLLLVITIITWSYVLNLLAFRYPFWRRIVQAPRVQLVRDGRLIRRNLEHEKITEEELLAEIHAYGCENISDVRAAWIEPDGMVRVIKLNGDADAYKFSWAATVHERKRLVAFAPSLGGWFAWLRHCYVRPVSARLRQAFGANPGDDA